MTAPPDSIMQTGAGLFDEIGGMLDDGLIIASAGGEIQSANNAAIRFLGEGVACDGFKLSIRAGVLILIQLDRGHLLTEMHRE